MTGERVAMSDGGDGAWWLQPAEWAIGAIGTAGVFALGWIGKRMAAARAEGQAEAALVAKIDRLDARLAIIERDRAHESEAISQLSQTYRGLPATLNEQLGRVEARLNTHGERLERVERRNDLIDERLTKLTDRVALTPTRQELSEMFGQVTQRLDNLISKA